jgi:hypothetical protein
VNRRGPLRAPAEDGAVLADPPLEAVGPLLDANRRRLHDGCAPVLGRAWDDLRRQARADALAAARDYLRAGGEPVPAADGDALLVAGHQPELFHPGVWVKNFALQGLARRHGGVALNLVVDNDTMKSAALRVPSPATAESAWPHAVTVPFDRWTGEIPYEERPVVDPELFRSFADRAGAVLAGWGYEPLLASFWPEVLRQYERTPLVGECFAAARRAFEQRWGCHNFEVPVSALCGTESFAWFAAHLLAELPRFHAIYNECVRAYRRLYGIRSRNHPVPDLAARGDWLEAPFWGWRPGAARRGRLFARAAGGRIELRTDAGDDPWPSLPRPELRTPNSALRTVEAWRGLGPAGWKVRNRALTTTLFARRFLGDLFMHGIGGGKYDELTDEILRRFYGCEPPSFLVLSATRRLPLPHYPVTPEDGRRLARVARDVYWNPQRHLDLRGAAPDPPVREAVRRREEWVRREPAGRAGRRERFRALRELTERIRAPLAGREEQLRNELAACEQELEANAVLGRRDYAFCLYPEALLRPFCTQFL